MLKLIFGCLIALSFSYANALELYSYKDDAVKAAYTEAQVNEIFASSTPMCVKDGSKVLGVNKAFKTAKLGYRDCSSSKNAKAKQALTGIPVHVIKVTELPANLAKKVLGIK